MTPRLALAAAVTVSADSSYWPPTVDISRRGWMAGCWEPRAGASVAHHGGGSSRWGGGRRALNRGWRCQAHRGCAARVGYSSAAGSFGVLRGCAAEWRYNDSTFVRAHGVWRRNLSDEFTLGSCVKHRISMRSPRPSHPYRSTRCSTIALRVTPCRGSTGRGSVIGADGGESCRYA